MKQSVNNAVNPDTKKAGLKLMEGGKAKINPPNSHPSNPIHKAATASQQQTHAASVEKQPKEQTPTGSGQKRQTPPDSEDEPTTP